MPSPGEDYQAWSTTALDNGSADTLINWVEGMPRADVNNSARGVMAALAKDRNLHNGSITTGGTANAQTFTSGVGYTAVPTGLRVLLKIGTGLNNTGAATLNMDSIGAVTIKDQKGTDLLTGALGEGSYCEFLYDGTYWRLLTPRAASSTITTNITTIIQTIISSSTTGSVASVDFTDLDTTKFPRYQVVITGFLPEVLGSALNVNFSKDNGATFPITTTDYASAETYYTLVYSLLGISSTVAAGQNGEGYLHMGWAIEDNGFPAQYVIDLFCLETGVFPVVVWTASSYSPDNFYSEIAYGDGHIFTGALSGCNAVRFWATEGNIAQGKFTLYGYP